MCTLAVYLLYISWHKESGQYILQGCGFAIQRGIFGALGAKLGKSGKKIVCLLK